MMLCINTIKDNADKIEVKIIQGQKELANRVVSARSQQSEKLIPAIVRLLDTVKISVTEIKKIKVENYGGSFTSLRIGVTTANALGYALQIPVIGTIKEGDKTTANLSFRVIKPMYDKNPDITISKKNLIGD